MRDPELPSATDERAERTRNPRGRRLLVPKTFAITSLLVLFGLGFAAVAIAPGASAAKPCRGNSCRRTTTTTISTTPTTTTTSGVAPLPANPSAPRLLGVSLAWSSSYLADLDAYAARVGRVPSVVASYRDMNVSMLDATMMSAISARGATPMVTVEPWDSSSATDPRYTLKNISRGDFDAWFAAGAKTALAYAKPFYLRFAPEMNGKWAPWEAGINGNTTQDYVDAWRHVHGIFDSYGVRNAIWVWSPNVFTPSGVAVNFTPYYPGSDEVDALALDGYNWGSLDVWQTWSQVFGSSYDALCTLDAAKMVMIGETASTESGGDKAAWIRSAFTQEIPQRTPRVKIVVWFNENKETDWRVESSSASLSAFSAVATSQAWG
jgi:Glycosyl hydrolase family 26